jgi:nucleotide-binding universal stress UspA family protein
MGSGKGLLPMEDETPRAILVVEDGSLASQTAADLAIQIAHGLGLSIRGLYVVDATLVLDSYMNYHRELGDAEDPASRAQLVAWFEHRGDRILNRLAQSCQAANVPVTTDLLFGGVPDLILDEAPRAQLLAMGRYGRAHDVKPDYLGRNFRAIAHHAHRPILVGGDMSRPVQRLLLAYNQSEHAQRALAWASRLQHALAASVAVLAVQENGDMAGSSKWAAEMQDHLAREGLLEYHLLHAEGEPATEIVAAAARCQADLVVMGGYRHVATVEWLFDSTLEHVLRNTGLPVLVA